MSRLLQIFGLSKWGLRVSFSLLLVAFGFSFQTTTVNSSKVIQDQGTLHIKIVDSLLQEPVAVRIRVTQNGRVVSSLPKQAIAVMYGLWDHADGYGFQPDSSFYINGEFNMTLPSGRYEISVSKGPEYLIQQHAVMINAGASVARVFQMKRWIDMPSRGWYSADDHIHVRRSQREDSLLMTWIQAEDIHVGMFLKMGDFWATYYDQYAWGNQGVYQNDSYCIAPGQEDPRTPEIGHALGFGATEPVRYSNEYYYYDRVFDRLHELGGITGYAHQAESFHGYRGLMLDALRKKVDVLELLQFCVSEDPLQTRYYYQLLDLGYAVTAVAGSDFPWCGHEHDKSPPEQTAQIGNVRFYTYVDQPFSFSSWKEAVRKGHTFVSSGPMLEMTVNGKLPGDTVYIDDGSLNVTVSAFGNQQQIPLKKLEIVMHGNVIGTTSAESSETSARLFIEKEIKINEGCWIAARVYAGPGQVAHTTPVYVLTDKRKGFQNSKTVSKYVKNAEDYLRELEQEMNTVNNDPERQAWRYRKGLQSRINATLSILHQLKSQAK